MKLSKPQQKTYAVACSPLQDIYHIVELNPNQEMGTGLPIVVYGLTKEEAYDIVFSDWTEDEDSEVSSYTEREFMWSVGYTKQEADETISELSDIMPNVMMNPVKHKDREEYSIPFDEYVFEKLPGSAKKDLLRQKHLQKISDGKSKQKNWMKDNGWV